MAWSNDHGAFDALARRGLLEYGGGLLPPSEARRVLATSDDLLLLDLIDRDAGLQVPAKIFEYIRIGRPILVFTASGSPVHEIVQRSGIPHCFVLTRATPAETDREVLSLVGLPTTPGPAQRVVPRAIRLHPADRRARPPASRNVIRTPYLIATATP